MSVCIYVCARACGVATFIVFACQVCFSREPTSHRPRIFAMPQALDAQPTHTHAEELGAGQLLLREDGVCADKIHPDGVKACIRFLKHQGEALKAAAGVTRFRRHKMHALTNNKVQRSNDV